MLPRALLCCALAMLAGCTGLPARRTPAPAATTNTAALNAELLASYTRDLLTVVQGNATEQAEVVSAARSGYEQAHQGPAVLRYALLLATPGHPEHNAQTALRLLNEALAHPELLSSGERALAIVERARVQLELDLAADNARLVADAQAESDRQRNAPSIPALTARLQAELNENARLKKEIDEAKAKLDAIANIERNSPPRPPANEARKP